MGEQPQTGDARRGTRHWVLARLDQHLLGRRVGSAQNYR
jgi:hypothetical protein